MFWVLVYLVILFVSAGVSAILKHRRDGAEPKIVVFWILILLLWFLRFELIGLLLGICNVALTYIIIYFDKGEWNERVYDFVYLCGTILGSNHFISVCQKRIVHAHHNSLNNPFICVYCDVVGKLGRWGECLVSDKCDHYCNPDNSTYNTNQTLERRIEKYGTDTIDCFLFDYGISLVFLNSLNIFCCYRITILF